MLVTIKLPFSSNVPTRWMPLSRYTPNDSSAPVRNLSSCLSLLNSTHRKKSPIPAKNHSIADQINALQCLKVIDKLRLKKTVASNETIKPFFSPLGLSGSPVFCLSQGWNKGGKTPVVGVVIEHHKKKRASSGCDGHCTCGSDDPGSAEGPAPMRTKHGPSCLPSAASQQPGVKATVFCVSCV